MVQDPQVSNAIARVAIHHPDDSFNYFCTGALIDEYHVLTARHCAENMVVPHVILGRGDQVKKVEVEELLTRDPHRSFNNFLTPQQ